MKLYMLECDGGFIKENSGEYQCVSIDRATVANMSYLNEIEFMAVCAKEAGCGEVRLVELTVAEGECVKKF